MNFRTFLCAPTYQETLDMKQHHTFLTTFVVYFFAWHAQFCTCKFSCSSRSYKGSLCGCVVQSENPLLISLLCLSIFSISSLQRQTCWNHFQSKTRLKLTKMFGIQTKLIHEIFCPTKKILVFGHFRQKSHKFSFSNI